MKKLYPSKMAGFFAALAIAALSTTEAVAEPLQLGEGLSIASPNPLEVIYQTIPSYNASKKMLTHSNGEKLQYFISIDRLPRNATDPERYFERLLSDISNASAPNSLEIINKGNYQADSGVRGAFVEYAFVSPTSRILQHQIAHYLTNSYRHYAAIGVLIDHDASDLLREDSVTMFKTASISTSNTPILPAPTSAAASQ